MLSAVRVEDHRTVLRLLAKHHTDLARWRNKICCRLHAPVADLVPGGISKEVVVSLAVELAHELVHVDGQLKAAKANIRTAVTASGTTLADIFGVGPVIAAMIIGDTGDPYR